MAAVLAPEIEAGLQLIRVRQRRLGHILMGLIPFVLVASAASVLPADTEGAFIAAAAIYGALLLAYSLRLAFTECPRCQGFYHWKMWSDPWTRRGLHCGLSLEDGNGS